MVDHLAKDAHSGYGQRRRTPRAWGEELLSLLASLQQRRNYRSERARLRRPNPRRCLLLLVLWSTLPLGAGSFATRKAAAIEHVAFRRNGEVQQVEGRLIVAARDGGVMLQDRAGELWTIQPEEIVSRRSDEAPFEPFSAEELAGQILEGLPDGFRVHKTAHYLIVHSTGDAYARWCGLLFERLYTAFTNYWSRRRFELSEPEFPLVAIVFADFPSFQRYARAEAGEVPGTLIGYYNIKTNRMVMSDLTASSYRPLAGSRRTTAARIRQMLAQPDARENVATVVHEATHQISFNCGLLRRESDCPLWFGEGIAIYFETPDLQSTSGWRGIGQVNQRRLARFRQYLAQRPADSIEQLVADDHRFRDPALVEDAYAEAWALTYFLIRRHPDRFHQYARTLQAKPPGVIDDRQTRLRDFRQAFGDDLEALDRQFIRYILRAR